MGLLLPKRVCECNDVVAYINTKRARPFSFHQHDHREAAENFSADRQLELIAAGPIQNPLILAYLAQERFIPAELAKKIPTRGKV